MMRLREGDKAPDFTAGLPEGESVRLSDLRKGRHVVLSFYPQDFSFGCTQQLCSYRNRYGEFLTLGAIVVGVSVDADVSHDRFRSKYQFPFPLISDPDRSLARTFGVEKFHGALGLLGLRPRVTFVIDRDGFIRRIIRHNVRFTRHVDEALSVLRTLGEGQR